MGCERRFVADFEDITAKTMEAVPEDAGTAEVLRLSMANQIEMAYRRDRLLEIGRASCRERVS
jgi:hypothetical protein